MKRKLVGMLAMALILQLPATHAEDDELYDNTTSIENCLDDDCTQEDLSQGALIVDDEETEVTDANLTDDTVNKKKGSIVNIEEKNAEVLTAQAPKIDKKKWWQFWKRSGSRNKLDVEKHTKERFKRE
jgi:hypothetical protein